VGQEGAELGVDDLGALFAFGLGLLAMARFMLSGSWMSLSSTRVTSTPQATVDTSRILRMARLILSVSDSVWSRVCWPTTFRSVVWAIWSIAEFTSSMATTDLTASVTR
jgi:hypothetical protein